MKISEEQKEKARQYVTENMYSGLSCGESVLNALIRAEIIDYPESITALASGLNGGVGSSGYTCGALSGAMIGIGAVYGRKHPIEEQVKIYKNPNGSDAAKTEEEDVRFKIARRYNNAVQEFKERTGTVNCQDVVKKAGGYGTAKWKVECTKMIKTGLEVALKYIEMEDEEAFELPFGENIAGWK